LRKNLNDFVDLLKTAGVRWDIKNGKILAPDEVWAQYLKVCGTFYSILVKYVLGSNKKVSLEP